MEPNEIDSFKSWNKCKENLSKAINVSETVGMTHKTIDEIAYRIGNLLSTKASLENREHRLLNELWKVGDNTDRRTLAKLIIKMIEYDTKH